MEAAKGKQAIEVGMLANLIPTLDTLKTAIVAGELDAQIEAAGGQIRSGFVSKK